MSPPRAGQVEPAAPSEPVRATVAVVGGFVLGTLAVAVEGVPIVALALVDDPCGKELLSAFSLPLALVGTVLALGAAYLAVVGHRSPHAAVVLALFTVAIAGAVTVFVLAVGSPETGFGAACLT